MRLSRLCRQQVFCNTQVNQLEAKFIASKEQSDYIFRILDPITGNNSKRIKVRNEQDKCCLIYVYNREANNENIQFDLYEVQDQKIMSIFTSLYGQPLQIRKRREIWELCNLVFHLDSVQDVGDIFEIEVVECSRSEKELELTEILKLFEDYLLDQIQGSNEDLIANNNYGK